MKWTKEQEKVINTRNKNILVSAAAGSGKTAVLVERIIQMITDEKEPIDIDKLLVVTFTNAAAAQMRERIGLVIEKRLASNPNDTNLQKQLTLLNTAHITTIHSFCLNVIRNYFHTIDLDPSFRMAEESEIALLKSDVVSIILEQYYDEGSKEFLQFVESYSYAKSDAPLEDIILDLYDFSISYPWPVKWLDEKQESFNIKSLDDLENAPWISGLIDYIKSMINNLIDKNIIARDICDLPDGPEAYMEALLSDYEILSEARKANSYTEFALVLSNITYKRLSNKKQPLATEDNKDRVKMLREEVKTGLSKLNKQFFYQTSDEMVEDIRNVKDIIGVLFELTKEFIALYEIKKSEKNIIDFNDLEHFALRILQDENVASELRENFVEILIDEYQDSNLVQETILTSISRENIGQPNVFMVGDVKQSIYKFRLAMPELFMNKFDAYSLKDEINGNQNLYQRIDLDKNFRSRDVVLNPVNHIFEQIMIKDIGGIEYNEDAFLKIGANYEVGEKHANSLQCILVESDNKEMEARVIANKIKELTSIEKGIMILDDGTKEYRLAEYRDITILLRTMVSWSDIFVEILMGEGIPAYADTSSGYFQTLEIRTLTSMLQIIDNPRQDIPFAAVLHSPLVDLTTNELGLIKGANKNHNLYTLSINYIENGENDHIKYKLKKFLDLLNDFRSMIAYKPIDELILEILNRTSYYDYVAVLPAGEKRQANIDLLISHGKKFSKGSYKGLFHFIRYIEKLKRYEVDFGEASTISENDNSVRIMSIHKSKGLEFPIVFASGMSKMYNMMDARDSIIYHFDYGIGPDYIDLEKRTKVATLLKKVIQNNIVLENLGEELRVLYVALTRAKEQLIITGQINDVDKVKAKDISFYDIVSSKSYLDLIIPALINKGYEDNILIVNEDQIYVEESRTQIFNKLDEEDILEINKEKLYNEDYRSKIKDILDYQYPYEEMGALTAKYTVSELKRREDLIESEDSINIFSEGKKSEKKPSDYILGSRANTSAGKGVLYHKIIEKMDVLSVNEYNLDSYMKDLIIKGHMSSDEMGSLNVNYIKSFIKSNIFARMKEAKEKNKLYREKPFVIGIDSKEIYGEDKQGEMILVQGMIDTYFEEKDELVLVDYKSDRIGEDDIELLINRYKTQMYYYKKALEQITRQKVKEVIIYSLALGKEILYE